jgi:hypothetical protein
MSAEPLSPDPVGSDDERGLPTPQPKRPIVANPATPGVQTPNKPDGRDAPPLKGQALLDNILPPPEPTPFERSLANFLAIHEQVKQARRVESRRKAEAFVSGIRRDAVLARWRRRQVPPTASVVRVEHRPRERRARRVVRSGSRGDPSPEPPPPAGGFREPVAEVPSMERSA